METQWFHLQQVMKGNGNSASIINEPFFLRLIQNVEDRKVGPLDLCKAYQDALRCALAHGINELSIPMLGLKIEDANLSKFGLRRDPLLDRVMLVEKNLSGTEIEVYKRTRRRYLKETQIDLSLSNALNDSNYKSYNGLGQQTAIRTVLTSPEDSTHIINLPTGCGKTLVAHALMLHTPPNLLTLVIVPTVGLAIEQSQRAKEMLIKAEQDHGGEYAWYGNQTKDQRNQIRDRLKNSTQRVLFCAPESAVGALLPILFQLANSKQLGALVVDEAHLISHWGGEFRPEFQLIPPLMNSLQSVSARGIRKILMSATFSPYTLQMLRDLFDPVDSKIIEVNGSFLRPEPSYFLKKSKIDEHQDAVLLAINHLPRPMILYTTKVQARDDDPLDLGAIEWYEKLRSKGFNRVGLFHGGTSPVQRERLINSWRNDEIDIMVATSAFGVGMDKSDVRSVIHAAVPENLDRYYQEAGRGGRDGNASLAYLICHDSQLEMAEELNREKIIGTELGLDHWYYMHQSALINEKQYLRVDLNTQRRGIVYSSSQNLSWNWRTLLLMQRSGFIKLHFSQPIIPEKDTLTSDSDYQVKILKYFDSYFSHVDVEILHDGHLNQKDWDSVIGTRRKLERSQREHGFKELFKWISNSDFPLCNILQKFYTDDGYAPELACGGCPACRNQGRGAFTPTLGINRKTRGWPMVTPKLSNLPISSEMYVYYSELKNANVMISNWKVWIVKLIQNKSIQAIRGRRDVLELVQEMLPGGCKDFWCCLDVNEENLMWSELALFMPTEKTLPKYTSNERLRIIIAHKEMTDSRLSYRRWWEVKSNAIAIEHFVRRVLNVNH